MRFARTTRTEATSTVAVMTGKSAGEERLDPPVADAVDVEDRLGEDGAGEQAAKSRPKIVMIGTMAARSACWKITSLGYSLRRRGADVVLPASRSSARG